MKRRVGNIVIKMNYWIPLVLVFILAGISILIAFLAKTEKNVPVGPLAFDALPTGFGPNATVLTLRPEHVGASHQIPRILHRNLSNINRRNPKNVHVQLPPPTGTITLLEAETRVDKSALIKIVSKHRFRIHGNLKDHVYMWRVPGEGDVVFTPGKTQYGESVWDCSCSGQNLQDISNWFNDLANFGKSIEDCMGAITAAAAFFGDPEPDGSESSALPDAGGISSAVSCAQELWGANWNCLLGDGQCTDNNRVIVPPLTNADIQRDVSAVLQRQIEAQVTGALVTGLQKLQSGTLSMQNYLQKLYGTAQNNGYSALVEYGNSLTGNGLYLEGDPNLVESSLTWDADSMRTFLAGPYTAAGDCPANSTPLCNMVTEIEALFNGIQQALNTTANAPDSANGEPSHLFYMSMWPALMSLLQKYVGALQEMSFRTSLKNGGKYIAPWEFLMYTGDPRGIGGTLQNNLIPLLPLVYTFYAQYVQAFQNNFVWNTITMPDVCAGSGNCYQLGLFYNNYCGAAWCSTITDVFDGVSPSYCGGAGFSGYGGYTGRNLYSLVNNNFDTVSNTILDVGYTYSGNPNGVPSNWPSNWTNYPFPGFAFPFNLNITSSNAVVSSLNGGSGLFCSPTKDDAQRTAIVNSYTQWFHRYNGSPFEVLDMIASMAGLTCSQVGSGSITYICTPITSSPVYGISTAAFPFGFVNKSVSLNNKSELMCSNKFPISLDYSKEYVFQDGDTYSSYSTGWSFDTSLQSASGFFSVSDIMCCPKGTVEAQGCWNANANVSVGNESSKTFNSRTLYCVSPFQVGNNASRSAIIPAKECILQNMGELVFPIQSPQTYKASATSLFYPSISDWFLTANEDNQFYISFKHSVEFLAKTTPYLFMELGIPLMWSTFSVTPVSGVWPVSVPTVGMIPNLSSPYGDPAELLRALVAEGYPFAPVIEEFPVTNFIVDTISNPSLPVCDDRISPNVIFVQGDAPSQYTGNTQMVAYNFAFSLPHNGVLVKEIPTVITLSDQDGTNIVVNRNDALLQSYTRGSDDAINGPYTGICTTLGNVNCPVGMTFRFYDTNSHAMINSFTSQSTVYLKVFEFITSTYSRETPASTQNCTNTNLPAVFCQECPYYSYVSHLNWSGFSNNAIAGVTTIQTPPQWTVEFQATRQGPNA